MTEGMQHIRIMEGVSRSLPSSPLLAHQAIGVRLQPLKKLTGKAVDVKKLDSGVTTRVHQTLGFFISVPICHRECDFDIIRKDL
ncbi:hypothetical protein GOODEAATRI_004934 [Goodea atripinnis]|uniref:Uncharacterized protein n=1 Tax=Goodea atripinnis TaxID=208336 RepID=A0ABV0N1Z5_9TELE